MVEVLSQATHKARKAHSCDASYFLRDSGIDGGLLTFTELRAIANAKANNYRILPGQQYLCQNNKMDGVLYCFRAIPAIHAINIRLNLYSE